MLQDTKFSITEISHFSSFTNAYILLRSLAGVTGIAMQKVKGLVIKKNQIEDSNTGKSTKESRTKVLFRQLRKALYLFVSPIILFEGAVKRGASMTVYATPNKSPQKGM
jgi:hypothetical protein